MIIEFYDSMIQSGLRENIRPQKKAFIQHVLNDGGLM